MRLRRINQKFCFRARWTHDDLAVLVNYFLLHEHGVTKPKRFACHVNFFERVWLSFIEALRPKCIGKTARAIGQDLTHHFGQNFSCVALDADDCLQLAHFCNFKALFG